MSVQAPRLTISTGIVGACLIFLAWTLLAAESGTVILPVAGVSLLGIALFATRLLPETVTAVGCFLAFLALGVAPPEIIFSGFASGGFWLLFSGIVIGTAITVTGLGQQIALRIFRKTGNSYRRAALLLALSGLALGLIVPSTLPRVIVLVPIALSLAQTMGFAVGSRGHVGLTVTAATATLLPTYAILTANLPTIIHFGAIETLYGIKPSYAQYFLEQAPINMVRFAVLVALMLPYAPDQAPDAPTLEEPTPLDTPQKRLSVLMGVAILFWATDGWHGISPAWVALTLAAVLLVPAFGMLDGQAMKSKIDLSTCFFIAGVFAISAVAQYSGLSAAVADRLIPLLALGGGGLRDLYAISGASMLLSHLVTAPAAPVVLAPLAAPMAEGAGWNIEAVSMAQVIGIATPLLPFQAPPLIVSMALGKIPPMPLVRVCLALALAVAVIGIPVTYVWWSLLGTL